MAFSKRRIYCAAVAAIVPTVVASGAFADIVTVYDQDFTSLTPGTTFGGANPFGQANPVIRSQSSWRNPAQTYLGLPATSTPFSGDVGTPPVTSNVAYTASFAGNANATLLANHVFVYSASVITDVASANTAGYFSANPGVSYEDTLDNTNTTNSYNSGNVIKQNTSVAAQNIADNYAAYNARPYDAGNLAAANVILPQSLTAANLPALLNAPIVQTSVYTKTASGGTQISVKGAQGTYGYNASTSFFKNTVGEITPQIWNVAPSTNVTYSTGAGGQQDVAFTQKANLELGLTAISLKQYNNTDFNLNGASTVSGDGVILRQNIGNTAASFFQGDANGDGSVTVSGDGVKLRQAIGGADAVGVGVATAKVDPSTGKILVSSNGVSFVEFKSTGNNFVPGNAVAASAVPPAGGVFNDAPTTSLINYLTFGTLGNSGVLDDFSIGAVLPVGFTNVGDLSLRYLDANQAEHTVSVSLVPEPTAIAMLGLGGLFALNRRRRQVA